MESAVSTRGVSEDYSSFCELKSIEPMCPSAFGKMFNKVFPQVTVRRLGPRGENFNHYYNLGRKLQPNSPTPTPTKSSPSFPQMLTHRAGPPPTVLRGGAATIPPLLPPPSSSRMLPHLMPFNFTSPMSTLPPFPPLVPISQPVLSAPQSPHYPLWGHATTSLYPQHSPTLQPVAEPPFFPDVRIPRSHLNNNSPMRLELMPRLSRYSEWYLNEFWPFQPINPAALEPDNLKLFVTSDIPVPGRESLGLSSFLAMSVAAFNHGDFEVSREFFHRARSQLGYLFDETSIDIAFVLQPMSIISQWWTGREPSAYYHTLLCEMCGQLNALNSSLLINSLQIHFLIRTYDVKGWKNKIEALGRHPRYSFYPEHWPSNELLVNKLQNQGESWHMMIAELLDVIESLSCCQGNIYKAQALATNRDERHHNGRTEGEGLDGVRDEGEILKKLNEAHQKLVSLNDQVSELSGDPNPMPRCAMTVLKVWIFMVDIEYKAVLDHLEQKPKRGSSQRQDHHTAKSKESQPLRTTSYMKDLKRRNSNKIEEENGWAEKACVSLVNFFSSMELPMRATAISVIHKFIQGPLLDILIDANNLSALNHLLDLVSPLSAVVCINDIRQRIAGFFEP